MHKHIDNIVYLDVYGNRGEIFDTHGERLATQGYKYDFWINPLNFNSIQNEYLNNSISTFLSEFFNNKKELYIYDESKKYAPIIKNIPSIEANEIINICLNTTGIINYDKKLVRVYPKNIYASQTIGYLDYENNPINGIEYSYNNFLLPKKCKIKHRKEEKGNYYPINRSDIIGLDGYDIVLSIDYSLQNKIQTRLEEAIDTLDAISANAILIEPKTGAIKSIVSVPAFNPNSYNVDPISYQQNKVIKNPYEPGSTFKIITLAAVIELGYLELDDTLYCEEGEYILPNGKKLKDHKAHGNLSIEDITAHSSNIGFSKISDYISNELLYKYMKYSGFGTHPLLLNTSTENGNINPVNTWNKVDKTYFSIGQGVHVSNLQLALGYSIIANGGYLMEPILVEKIIDDGDIVLYNEQDTIRKVFSYQTCSKVIQALERSIDIGTGKNLGLDNYNIAGKTGTAQIWDNDLGQYSDSLFIASFATIFPSNDPRYVLIISIDSPKDGYHYASASAVPIANKIINDMFILDPNLKEQCKKDKNLIVDKN